MDNWNILRKYFSNLKEEEDIEKYLYDINIPKYEDMIKLSKKLACEMTEFKEIEWLFTLDDNKIELLGCGMWNNYIFAQKQIYLNNKNGLYSYYKTKRF